MSLVEDPALEHPTEAKQIAAKTKNERCFKAFVFIVLLGLMREVARSFFDRFEQTIANRYNQARIITNL